MSESGVEQVKSITEIPNTYAVVNTANGDEFAIEASGDRIIIQEDKMKFGFECKMCDGEGCLQEPCERCSVPGDKKGKGYIEDAEGNKVPCNQCNQQRGLFGQRETQGYKTCTDCKGRGALIVFPQSAERRPTTGIVKSLGPDVSVCPVCKGDGCILIQGVLMNQDTPTTGNIVIRNQAPAYAKCLRCKGEGKVGLKLKVGDRVIYPIFAGTAINFKQKGTARILHENEITGKIYGTGNIGDIVK